MHPAPRPHRGRRPQIWVGGKLYFATTIAKDATVTVPNNGPGYEFDDEAKVELYEASGRADHTSRKQIGATYEVTEKNPPLSPMDFKTSGAHYTLTFSVKPAIETGPTTA